PPPERHTVKIALDLPEFTVDTSVGYADPYYDPGTCASCGYERSDTMAKLVPFGWLHTVPEHEGEKSCLQKVVDGIQKNAWGVDPSTAWKTVAQHVAKYPSRHSVSEIRAVITALMKPA
ncbi:hypothetical protein ACFVWR_18945, partial [Leifsonia sp. NPDC058292]|uniref:hypothetical protein n=1 Tax=Leifsonia sp. NPDC058292 TaxID=3346428 RepID=UPI0036DC4CC0